MKATVAICNAQIFNGYQMLQADTVLIHKDKILTVGDYATLKNLIKPSTQIINAQQQFLMPAFIEGHGHFANLGFSKMKLDLAACNNWTAILKKVKKATTKNPSGTWIEGEGWHQEKWETLPDLVQGLPTNYLLNAVSSNHPVVLWHASLHSALVNQMALQILGFDENSQIDGGQLIRNTEGKLTGMLIENAINPVWAVLKKFYAKHSHDRFFKALQIASEQCLQHGITLFQDADIRLPDLEKYLTKQGQDALQVKLWMMMHEGEKQLESLQKTFPFHHKKITVGAIKRYMDGAIGNHGAWFIEPYTDKPETNGHCTLDIHEFKNICAFAAKHQLQMATHAIGDLANRTVLEIYSNCIQQYALEDHRWRVEHAQHIHPDDLSYFSENQILASIQTNHCTSDASYVEKRLGSERLENGAYLWQTLIQNQIKINNGTDCPIEPIDPIANFYAAITRKYHKNKTAFHPKENLSRLQALKACTIQNAYAAKLEHQTGSIEPGKTADLTLLSKNLLHVNEEDILNTKVILTIQDGSLVYENKIL